MKRENIVPVKPKISEKKAPSSIKKKISKKSIISKGNINSGHQHHLAKYISNVRNKIADHKYKNRLAKRLKLTGEVKLKFNLSWQNKITDVEVITPSKYQALNQSALTTMEMVKRIPSFPKEITEKNITVTMNMVF